MSNRFSRALLRRIALGLPVSMGPIVVAGPLVLAGCLAGCGQTCTAGATITTRHAATDDVIARLGMDESFMPEQCRELCLELDGVDEPSRDAGVGDGGASLDAGPSQISASFARTATVTCAYESETEISCAYQGQTVCTGGGGCFLPPCAIAGRLPDALTSARAPLAHGAVARWLATTAHLEAAAVPAFDDLAEELRLHGAPRRLSAAASRSAHDERRHARIVRSLALRVGALPPAVERSEREPRSLLSVAIDNAVEGTVREAYGALLATMQATHAKSASVRGSFRAIARDEARHALLSLAAHDWMTSRLSARDQATVRERADEARLALLGELASEPDALSHDVLGLPDATRATDALALV